MELKFRKLKAEEIDCRVSQVFSKKGLTLLLYKDARVDQNILDETVGPMNWQRHHTRDNANCIVSIWDTDKKQWIEKEDTGAESYTEKEKGLASDSFKRACFNWGIGRELYTSPFIWVNADGYKETTKSDGKATTKDKFKVTKINYNENGDISQLEIYNINLKRVVYTYGLAKVQPKEPKAEKKIGAGGVDYLKNLCEEVGSIPAAVCDFFKVSEFADMTVTQFNEATAMLESKKNGKTK